MKHLKNMLMCSIALVFAGVVALAAASPPGTLGNGNAAAISAPVPVDTGQFALANNAGAPLYGMTPGPATTPPYTGIGNVARVENSTNSTMATTPTRAFTALASISDTPAKEVQVAMTAPIVSGTGNMAITSYSRHTEGMMVLKEPITGNDDAQTLR